jgi:hypothetical protein
MVLTVSFVLSLVIGLVVTIANAMRKHCRQLDASVGASGPHDFAVREVCALVSRAIRVHRIPTNVRDDGQRPSFGRDGRSCRSDLPDGLSEIFFRTGLDTPDTRVTDLPVVGQITCRALMSVKGDAVIPGREIGLTP